MPVAVSVRLVHRVVSQPAGLALAELAQELGGPLAALQDGFLGLPRGLRVVVELGGGVGFWGVYADEKVN